MPCVQAYHVVCAAHPLGECEKVAGLIFKTYFKHKQGARIALLVGHRITNCAMAKNFEVNLKEWEALLKKYPLLFAANKKKK